MQNSSPLFLAENRSWTYWFADGLPQFVMGISAVLFGLFFIFMGTPSSNKPLVVLSIVAFIVYMFIQVRMAQILEWLKARITYPRIGYAASPYFAALNDFSCAPNLNLPPAQDPNAPSIAEIKSARQARNRRLSLTYILIAVTSLPLWLVHVSWICALIGTVMGIELWIGTRADKSVSLLAVLGFPIVGFFVGALQFAPFARVGSFIIGAGLLFILEGMVSLLLFFRRNPVPQGQA